MLELYQKNKLFFLILMAGAVGFLVWYFSNIVIFIIIAGWQKAMGNDHLFVAALVGTVIMFSAPQVVPFISASFGG